MRAWLQKIFPVTRERGFTLVEAVIVAGLTTLITVGVVAGLIEGLDALHEMTDQQSVEFGHQRTMQSFMADAQAATWFSNTLSTVHDESGALVSRDATEPFSLVLGYPGPDDEEIWVRYGVTSGTASTDSYLVRAMCTSTGRDGITILTPGVARLEFNYYDSDGNITDTLSKVSRISMVLSLTVGGATEQREYFVAMRNPNMGVQIPPADFNDVVSRHFRK